MLAAASCSSDETSAVARLGDGCLLNSDCNDDLVCVFRRCHIECETSGDCPTDGDGNRLRCVVGDKPDHVCQLADETACAYHSECPGEQICGPDGACRDQCQTDRDCVEGQSCLEQGVCAEPEELNDEGELEGVVQPEEQETGLPCAYDSQCEGVAPEGGPPFVCINGGCNYGCYTTVDCEPNFECQPVDMDATTPGACVYIGGGTATPCIPGYQVVCRCWPPEPPVDGIQTCNDSGTGFVECLDPNGMSCSFSP